jgi:hypothetical protein
VRLDPQSEGGIRRDWYDQFPAVVTMSTAGSGQSCFSWPGSFELRLILCLVSVYLLLGFPSPAVACDCEGSLTTQFEEAEAVFFGVVKSVHNSGESQAERTYWSVTVQGVWKGPQQPSMRIYAYEPDGSKDACHLQLKVGQSYLVFARTMKAHPGRFRVSQCSGTVIGDLSFPALRFLGAPPFTVDR